MMRRPFMYDVSSFNFIVIKQNTDRRNIFCPLYKEAIKFEFSLAGALK